MPVDEYCGVERLQEVAKLIEGVKATYPDAKKLSIDIRFEWQTTDVYDDGAELCPIVKVYVER